MVLRHRALIGGAIGLRIHEVPVDWVDDPDSRVDIARTTSAMTCAEFGGCFVIGSPTWQCLRAGRPGHVGRSLAIRRSGGVQHAGVHRRLCVAVATHRWLRCEPGLGARLWTGQCGRPPATRARTAERTSLRHRILGTSALIGVSLAVTTGALAIVWAFDHSSLPVALVAVTLANAPAALARFWLLRMWVFRPRFRVAASPYPGVPTPTSSTKASLTHDLP